MFATWLRDDRFLVLVPLGLAALVYYPITHNYFFAGDFLNFYQIANNSLFEFLITPHGGHLLATRNFVWWVLYQFLGVSPVVFFSTVLLTHLTAVGLLFALTRRLTDSPRAACVVASLWGSAPVQEGTLGWYSVYGQALAMVIVGWLVYQLARAARREPTTGALLRWIVLLLAASTSFGVGIASTFVFPVVAYLLLPASPGRRRIVWTLGVVAALMAPLYWAMIWFYQYLYGPVWQLGRVYAGLYQLRTVVELTAHLLAYGVAVLLGGVWASGLDYPNLTGYVLAVGYVLLLLAVFVASTADQRRVMIAAATLCVASYAIVALGRAIFYTSGPFVRAPRYQYAGTFWLALLTAVALARLGVWLRVRSVVSNAALAGFVAVLLVSHLAFGPRIFDFNVGRVETADTLAAIRAAIDAAPDDSDVYIENREFRSIGPWIVDKPEIFPGWAGLFVIFFPDNVVDGKRVHFVAPAPVVSAAKRGRRTASLLVAPEQAQGQ